MVKRAIHLGKDSRFYEREIVHFATKHKKEEILSPLFHVQNTKCQAVAVDTDEFGTFSGEVERAGSVRQTLRTKINAAAKRS